MSFPAFESVVDTAVAGTGASPSEAKPPLVQSRRDLRIAASIGLACLLLFNLNFRAISAGDTYPARYLPLSLLRTGSVTLDPIASIVGQGRSTTAYWIVPGRRGQKISLYPVVLPVLIAPLYVPAALYLRACGWDPQRFDSIARVMEKLSASLMTAATAALFYLLLRRWAKPDMALLLTLAFALGTTTWVISSQALWQHTLAELLVVVALLLLTGPATAYRVPAAGLVCGLIASNRPPDSILAAALLLYALSWAGRRVPVLALAAALPVAPIVFYNLHVAGNLLGGYGIPPHEIQHRILACLLNLLGLLFSPTRGLFVFSPFLLFLLYRPLRVLSAANDRRLTWAMGGAIALQLLLYAQVDWRHSFSWGPRWLTDILPFLVLMLLPVVTGLGGWSRRLFVIACGLSIVIEAIGAFWYVGINDPSILVTGEGGAPVGAWNPWNAPFIAELRHGVAPPELTIDFHGSFDRIEIGGREVRKVAAGREITAEGWALAGIRTPGEVVFLLDGEWAGAASIFFSRPDVERALHETSPAGWRISFRTDGLAPGKHVLAGLTRASELGDVHLLGERVFLLQKELAPEAPTRESAPATQGRDQIDLARSSRDAVSAIRARQLDAGYWLTTYTSKARFEGPRPEMNTFLTAVIVDLLDPVASPAGLGDAVARARRHLAGQIEDTGLVRYHGRTDGPTIGTLGCAITPDADDTALVWRIAPGNKQALRTQALNTLGRYRTDDGLYRTWLAPQDRYQCIDPGRDPNPADAGIQMHVFMWLARVDPPSARALCGALQQSITRETAWVYYRQAPLIPILRQAELEKDGCPLRVPQSLAQGLGPDQDVWVNGGLLLNRVLRSDADLAASGDIPRWLSAVASDGFSILKRSPPLLYHNDLTASTPRFYWSDSFGYTLWLRLYFENARRS